MFGAAILKNPERGNISFNRFFRGAEDESTEHKNYVRISRKMGEYYTAYPEFVNESAIEKIREAKIKLSELIEKMNKVDDELGVLLEKETDDPRTKSVKDESEKLHRTFNNSKVAFLNDIPVQVTTVEAVTAALFPEQSSADDSRTVYSHMVSKSPIEICAFKYIYEPIIIYRNDFYFCIFETIVLIFDKTGTFSSALNTEPMKRRFKAE